MWLQCGVRSSRQVSRARVSQSIRPFRIRYLLSLPPLAMVLTAEQFRQRRALKKYGRNVADKLEEYQALQHDAWERNGQCCENGAQMGCDGEGVYVMQGGAMQRELFS